jgi:hypothetical protein
VYLQYAYKESVRNLQAFCKNRMLASKWNANRGGAIHFSNHPWLVVFIGLAYYQGKKDIVFRFIIEYGSLRDFCS